MENYFILLELPFDLPESDTNKISEAISKKQAQWSRDQSNPVKKAKASEYLAALEDIKKVMLDPTARKQEAAKAKQIKASKAKELEAKLSLYRAKGDELSEKDLKRLVKVFGAFGFTADEIKKKFGSGNKKQDKIDPSEVLDKTQARNVQNFMQQLDMKEKTLYDFLSLAPTASWNQLCEAADSMKKKILAKGDKTGRDNAVQSLCGLCVVIFKDVASKKKYDNYVNLTKYRAVNEAVDELALSNQKRIEPKMKESLIDIAVRQYHVSVSDASVYINHYCEYMGYALPENKIVCGLCGTENPAGTTNCVKCGKPLIIPCPACSAENNNSAKVCAKCGFDLTKMDKAVSNPAKGTFYAEVYTYFESDRHRVYSDACRALLSNEPQKDVFYTLKYKKSGLFSKKCTLTVEIETEGACVFPAFAIVSKFKSTPLKRGDGDIVCTVNENTEIKGSHTFEFDVSPMKADTRLKMFFLNDKNYKSFKIACKAGNNI